MTEAVAPRSAVAAVRWPVLPVLGGIAVFLAAWIGAYAIRAASLDSAPPWYVLNGAMLLLAAMSVGLLCRSRVAASAAAVLAALAVIASLLQVEQLWPVAGTSLLGDALPRALLGGRNFSAQLVLAGSFVAVALVPRGAGPVRSPAVLAAVGAVTALVALFLVVVLERVLLASIVLRSAWAPAFSMAFVLLAAVAGVAFQRSTAARLGGLGVAVGLMGIAVALNAPILGWNGDELRSSGWDIGGDATRLLRDTPFMWSSLVLVGAWLGIALGRTRVPPVEDADLVS